MQSNFLILNKKNNCKKILFYTNNEYYIYSYYIILTFAFKIEQKNNIYICIYIYKRIKK